MIKLRHFWTKEDLRLATMFLVNAIAWAIVIDLAYFRGMVLLAAVLLAVNLCAAVFRTLLFLKTHRDQRDINH